MSEKSEALLQELVDMHKEEFKQAQIHRWLRFFFGTLPAFVFLALSIWASVALIKSVAEFIENPDGLSSYFDEAIPSLPPAFGSDLLK